MGLEGEEKDWVELEEDLECFSVSLTPSPIPSRKLAVWMACRQEYLPTSYPVTSIQVPVCPTKWYKLYATLCSLCF